MKRRVVSLGNFILITLSLEVRPREKSELGMKEGLDEPRCSLGDLQFDKVVE